MKIFLDDIRAIPRGYEGARSYSEFIRIFEKNKGNVEEISLDHDLGEVKSGYDAAKWIVENDYFDGLKTIIIHSANPVGVRNMIQLFDRYAPADVEIFYMNLNKDYEKVNRQN